MKPLDEFLDALQRYGTAYAAAEKVGCRQTVDELSAARETMIRRFGPKIPAEQPEAAQGSTAQKKRSCPGKGEPNCWMEQDGYCVVCAGRSGAPEEEPAKVPETVTESSSKALADSCFTAIYTKSVGNYGASYPLLIRFNLHKGETLAQALNRAGYETQSPDNKWDISESTVFVFKGWPELEQTLLPIGRKK